MQTTLDANLISASPLTLQGNLSTGKAARWTGRVLSGLASMFLALDAVMKLVAHPTVIEGSQKLGLPPEQAPVIGAILAVCVALYLVPRTAVLGAVLLTGYLGGAVLTHLRVGDPLLSHTLFPIYFGALVWGGLFLRDARVRRLIAAR